MPITALVRKIANGQGKIELRRNRHRQRDLDREHRERDDQTQRRASRSRARPRRLGQSGRCNGAARPSKPAAPDDHIMGQILDAQPNHLRRSVNFCSNRRQHWGGTALKMAKWNDASQLVARYISWLSGYAVVFIAYASAAMPADRRLRRSVASPSKRSPGSARPAAARRGSRGRSQDRSRSGRRHGCSRTARCRRP